MTTPPESAAPPAPARRRQHGRKRRRDSTLSQLERRLVLAIAAAAAICAVFSEARPSGFVVSDAVLTAAFAAVVALAGSRAKRWSLVWFAGVSTAAAVGDYWLIPGAFALVLCGVAVSSRHRDKVLGAGISALAVQSALNIPDVGFFGLPSIVALVAVVPVLVSGYRQCSANLSRRIRRVALGFAAFVALAGAGFVVAGMLARPHVVAGVDASQSALAELRGGNQQEAARRFETAQREFDSAHRALIMPWSLPAKVVPVIGPQAAALSTAANAGALVSGAASAAASSAPYGQIRAAKGEIDLARLQSMRGPVEVSAKALRSAKADVVSVRSGWLAAPITQQLDRFEGEVSRTLPDAELAADALAVLPDLLGVNGTQHYFIAFGTPSETRFLGGFIGAYGELTASNGAVKLVSSGPVDELNEAPGADKRSLNASRTYQERYARYHPEKFFQNLTSAPDLPTNAAAIAELYPQVGGAKLDGVIYVDPYGLASMLKLTGPVNVEGLEQPLTPENAAAYLLKDQYLQGKSNSQRQDVLIAASRATFEALTSRDLPAPESIASALGPAVRGGHLQFSVSSASPGAFLDRLGVSGKFLEVKAGDYLDVRVANAGGNKIDSFLQQRIDYRATVDAPNGKLKAVATIELENLAPSSGLPDYLIGNLFGEPPGTNRLYMSIFTPAQLTKGERDGRAVGFEAQKEFGGNVYSALLAIPPGGKTTIELQLEDRIQPGEDYHLSIGHQPLVNDGALSVSVRAADGQGIASADGLTLGGGQGSWTGRHTESQVFVVRMRQDR